MLLTVPETIQNVIWEGLLEEEIKDTTILPDFRSASDTSWANIKTDELPIVSIGSPETWNLTELYEPDKIPRAIQTRLDEANFYLVRLSCSFRPIKDEIQISRAYFAAELLPDSNNQQPIAYDLYPSEVNQEVKRNFKITLNPTLKFEKVEGSIGSTEFGIEYPELQPVIIATGVGEREPAWEYQKAKGRAIQGSKSMHLLLKVPKHMQRVRAKLKLTADIESQETWLQRLILRDRNEGNEPKAYLPVRLV